MNENFTWEYDRYSRHYIIRNASLLFANFSGAAQNYNPEGRRNFRVEIDDALANEMESQGIFVRELEPRNEDEAPKKIIKISVYPDADIRLLSGRNMTNITIDNENKENDMAGMIDMEFRKGRVMNGHCDLEFHISKNTKVANSSPYLRVDMLVLPIRRSKLAEAYENYSDYDDDDDDLPM